MDKKKRSMTPELDILLFFFWRLEKPINFFLATTVAIGARNETTLKFFNTHSDCLLIFSTTVFTLPVNHFFACNSIDQPEIQAEVVSFNTYYNPVTDAEEMSVYDTEWCFTDKLSALKYLKKEWDNFYSNEIGVEIFDEIIFATDFRYDNRTWEVDDKSFKSKGDAVIYCMENCLSIRAITEK